MSKDFNKRLSKGKSIARLMAVQALYSNSIVDFESQAGWDLDALDKELLVIAKEFADNDEDIVKKIDKKFFGKIVKYVANNTDDLDAIIVTYLDKDWDMEKIGILLCSILRAALFELKEDPKTPPSIIISEYISITSEFFDKKEIGFVNAVLERMSKDIKDGIDDGAKNDSREQQKYRNNVMSDVEYLPRNKVKFGAKNKAKTTLKINVEKNLDDSTEGELGQESEEKSTDISKIETEDKAEEATTENIAEPIIEVSKEGDKENRAADK